MNTYRSTLTAAVVTAVAISIPCVAWFITGSSAARQEVATLLEQPKTTARLEAARLADQLGERLESMRHSESKRSHYDYQNVSDPFASDCSYEMQVNSSLAEGPADQLIWAHFQVDQVGQLTLPPISEPHDFRPPGSNQAQVEIFEELECATAYRLAAMADDDDFVEERLIHSNEGPVFVGPFDWYTLPIQGEPSLVGLRIVKTPAEVLTQGFVVLRRSLQEHLSTSPYPVVVEPGDPSQLGEGLMVAGTQRWTVRVDLSRELAAARERATRVERRFQLSFAVGTGLVGLAGAFLVGMIWQTNRLSHRRAKFAASAAHELRTPLAGLRLYSEMLAEGIGNPDHREKYARRISTEADRLGRVVQNVLGYSNLERGGMQVRPARGNLADTVRQAVDQLRPALEAKGAQLTLDIHEAVADAMFDRDAVHQILLNLIDNAEKYTRDCSDRRIDVQLGLERGIPVLRVRDHGKGIDPRIRARLFEPFTRTSDDSAPAGLGIGLALVKALASEQHADISVTEAKDGGSCFEISFQPI